MRLQPAFTGGLLIKALYCHLSLFCFLGPTLSYSKLTAFLKVSKSKLITGVHNTHRELTAWKSPQIAWTWLFCANHIRSKKCTCLRRVVRNRCSFNVKFFVYCTLSLSVRAPLYTVTVTFFFRASFCLSREYVNWSHHHHHQYHHHSKSDWFFFQHIRYDITLQNYRIIPWDISLHI